MKTIFNLVHPKIKLPRVVDSVKHEIRTFLKKSRLNTLPSGAKYWDFDCKIGSSEKKAVDVHLSSLIKNIDEFVANNIMDFYVEITPKAIVVGEATPAQEE